MTEKQFKVHAEGYQDTDDMGYAIAPPVTYYHVGNSEIGFNFDTEREAKMLCEAWNKLVEENEQLKSRINDLEWILGIRSDITPVYWGDRNFNCCILDLIGNGRQKSVLNYLYNHYRKNDYEIKDFDNTLREHGVKYGKYGWEKE